METVNYKMAPSNSIITEMRLAQCLVNQFLEKLVFNPKHFTQSQLRPHDWDAAYV